MQKIHQTNLADLAAITNSNMADRWRDCQLFALLWKWNIDNPIMQTSRVCVFFQTLIVRKLIVFRQPDFPGTTILDLLRQPAIHGSWNLEKAIWLWKTLQDANGGADIADMREQADGEGDSADISVWEIPETPLYSQCIHEVKMPQTFADVNNFAVDFYGFLSRKCWTAWNLHRVLLGQVWIPAHPFFFHTDVGDTVGVSQNEGCQQTIEELGGPTNFWDILSSKPFWLITFHHGFTLCEL